MNYHKIYKDLNTLTEDEKNNMNICIFEKQEDLINNRAIYGDEVYILNNEVINIKMRSNKKIVGILYMDSITQYGTNSSGYPIYLCKPLNPKYEHFYIASGKKEKMKMYVVFEFKEWNHNQRLPHGQVLEYLGKVGEEDSEYEMLRYNHELNFNRWRLSKEELEEKQNLLKDDDEKLIDYEVFSIDPIGSIDIDDAFHYKYIDKNKFEIGIHIASPTKYIEKEEDWMKILVERMSTVYLINKKYNVLPNELADDLCSLLENKKRFAISLIFDYEINDEKIELKNYCFRESIVKNRKNYRYEDVDEMINREFKKGDKEMKGMYLKTKEIFGYEELDSHKFVELWMIKTNEMVAKYLVKTLEDPTRVILRVCLPNKLVDKEKEIFEDQRLKKYMERKEMKSAIYKYYKENDGYMGHYMMNLDLYTHFTSPIRRSVDFYIHLLLLNKNVEKYDLDKLNSFVKRTRRLDRDLKRMNYIFKMKNNQVMTQVKGYIMEMTENYIKVYIPEYELEEKYFINDRVGYSKLKKIEYELFENNNMDENKIKKIKIDEKEFNLYEERDIKIWVFTKEDNFYRKLKIDIL